jgi:hypothetical protein
VSLGPRREQRAENREQRAESREQRADNRDQRADNREQRADNREQRAERREQREQSEIENTCLCGSMYLHALVRVCALKELLKQNAERRRIFQCRTPLIVASEQQGLEQGARAGRKTQFMCRNGTPLLEARKGVGGHEVEDLRLSTLGQ